ncbi:MAG: hypothetical protein J0I65_22045 [Variovorax sp.]|nr:hypothetical protein [Variovorax sp.]|tara:strand:+ start:101 stop:805 length:705 start_codon:yes stop_codon:yes gene_type:complete
MRGSIEFARFGGNFQSAFKHAFDNLKKKIEERFSDLAPEISAASRKKALAAIDDYRQIHQLGVLREPIISPEAMAATGLLPSENFDSRIVFLFTACAYVSLAFDAFGRGDDASAMLRLFDANYWFGFQESGDLRPYVTDEALESIFRTDRATMAAQAKVAKRQPVKVRAAQLIIQHANWDNRNQASIAVAEQLIKEFSENLKTESAAQKLVAGVIAELPNSQQYFKRSSNKKRR